MSGLLKTIHLYMVENRFNVDTNSMIILFFIYMDAFKEENVEELAHKTNFTRGYQFGELWSKTF